MTKDKEHYEKRNKAAEAQRRRLLAAVCAFCTETVPEFAEWDGFKRLEYAKNVACRAAGYGRRDPCGHDMFNRIGTDRLRSLTYAFSKRSRDMQGALAAVGIFIREVNSHETRNVYNTPN